MTEQELLQLIEEAKRDGREFLDLSSQELHSLPPEIGQLTNLKKLCLHNNRLTSLPSEISQLTNLTTLNLFSNKLSKLPSEIGQLTSLTNLFLYNNKLTTLPSEIGKLTNLNTLFLGSNKLISLPIEIGKLINLKNLHLGSNQLTNLPTEIGQITSLIDLNLRFNPLTNIPPEIRDKHWQEILNFLAQKLKQNVDYIYEAKLLIIGEGGAGKTTLAQKMKNLNYELKSDEESTEGIDVLRYKFPLDNTKEFQINIWDFGGQEIYHQTHQFFLTERSLYALVVDTRKEDTDFYYWLNAVELLSSESPLLIINNEKQDRQRDIDQRQLKSDFTNLKEILGTNLATNRGLPEILNQIKHYIRNLPHVGDALPAYWVKVREILEKDSRDYISFDEFVTICKQQGFTSLTDILLLSSYLHDLGVFLHFQKDDLLTKTVILRPTWGTDAVYKVLDTPQVRQNLGKFTGEDLVTIWHEEKYATMRGELRRLMMNFKLCYEIPSFPNHYIAPQLLSPNRPDYEWEAKDNLLLRYEYDFMPKGMLTRFIVEMHSWIENETNVWKTGVVLKKDGARVEIIELYRYHKGEIRIRVMGKRKRDFLANIRYEFDKIHDSYERLKYKILVPCNCSECKGSQSPYFYPWHILNKFIDDKQPTIQCQNSYEMIDVYGLVNHIAPLASTFYLNKEDKKMTDKSRVFHVQNMQYIESNSDGEVNWNRFSSNPEVNTSIKEITQILQRLQTEHPNVTETQAKDIIEAEFTEIQIQNPKKWQTLVEQLLNKERWFKGGKAALVAATDYYIGNSLMCKVGLAFLDEFSETPNQGE